MFNTRITPATTRISVDTIEGTHQSKEEASEIENQQQKIGHTRFYINFQSIKTDQLN